MRNLSKIILCKVTFVIAFVLLSLMPATSMAQQAVRPNAGQFFDQVRPLLPTPSTPPPPKSAVAVDLPPPDGPRLQVGTFRITGAAMFAEGQLHALVSDAEGQALSLIALPCLAWRGHFVNLKTRQFARDV